MSWSCNKQAYGPALSKSNFSILSIFCLVYNNIQILFELVKRKTVDLYCFIIILKLPSIFHRFTGAGLAENTGFTG